MAAVETLSHFPGMPDDPIHISEPPPDFCIDPPCLPIDPLGFALIFAAVVYAGSQFTTRN